MIRKILKFVAYSAVIFITAILVILLVLTKIYSPEKIRVIIADNLAQAIQRKVEIKSASFDVFKGLVLHDVTVFDKSNSLAATPDSSRFLSLNELELRYFLPALLKMELQIKKIVFKNPKFYLKRFPNGNWNFSDLVTADTSGIDTVKSDTTGSELPFTINLKEISFQNLQIFAQLQDEGKKTTIESGGITITLSETFVPRFSSKKFEKEIRSNFSIKSNKEFWRFEIVDSLAAAFTEYRGKIFANLNLNVQSIENLSLLANFSVNDAQVRLGNLDEKSFKSRIFPFPNVFSINLNLGGNIKTGNFSLHKLAIKISEQMLLQLTGEIDNLFDKPFFNLTINESKVDLHQVLTSFLIILPDSIREMASNLQLRGNFSLAGTKISGCPAAEQADSLLRLLPILNLKNFNFAQSSQDTLTKLQNFNLQFTGESWISNGGIQDIRGTLKVAGDKIISRSDTVEYLLENISSTIEIHLDEDIFPDTLIGNIYVGNIFDSPLKLDFNLKSARRANKFLADLSLRSDSLSVSKLTQGDIKGIAKINFQLKATTFDSIVGDLNISTNELEVISETENMQLDSLNASGKLLFSTDSSFERIRLLPSTFAVGNFGDLFFRGNLYLKNNPKLLFDLDSLIIKHARLMKVLPASIKEELMGLTFSGRTLVSSHAEVDLSQESDSSMQVYGNLKLSGAIDYPDQYISVGNITSNLRFKSNGISSEVFGEINTDSLVLIGIQDEPVKGIKLSTRIKMPDSETVQIDSALLSIPDWKMKFKITGKFDSLSEILTGKLVSQFLLSTQNETISILNDELALKGNLDFRTDIYLAGDNLRLNGLLETKKLDVSYNELVRIDSLFCNALFEEAFDLEKGSIIQNDKKKGLQAKFQHYFYDVFKPYYQVGRQNISALAIKKIEVGDYRIDNFHADISIKNEKFEIPNFHAELYAGNVSGQISADLGDGTEENIEWLIKANLARLNSSLLLPQRHSQEKSELDLTMELQGKGIDPANNLELSGFLYITKIGVKFTDNVLQALDPQQTDKSIQDTRKLLKWGYKPKLVSVEIKHDNLYPTIHLVKGSFFAKLIPLNLSGGKIELARIPLEIIFSSLESSSE